MRQIKLSRLIKQGILVLFVSTSIVNADNFELNTIKKDSSGIIVDNGLKVKNEQRVISTGYGINKKQALDNALQSAVQQYIGVVVDTETILKNDKLITDKILTASHGFVKTYDEVSTKRSNGLIEVKISAIVKSQEIFKKIKRLNISTITISNTEDIYARVLTKNKSKKDAEKILQKALKEYLSISSIHEMLNIKIINAKVQESKIKDNKIPILIKYQIFPDYKVYEQKIKKLEQVFKNLGGTLHKRVDLPYLKYGNILASNDNKLKKLASTDLAIIKKYGSGYRLDNWNFPKAWKDIYPFNGDLKVEGDFQESFQIILEVTDKNKEIILAKNIHSKYNYYYILLSVVYQFC